MKSQRQKIILELIKDKICLTQEDLQTELKKLGFDVTQSTVSRDIRELKLIKSRDKDGNYRYISNLVTKKTDNDSAYKEQFSRSVIDIKYALNNVVIKCHAGMASGACVLVDRLFGDMMLGSLAGDDTIIIVTESVELSKQLYEGLKNII